MMLITHQHRVNLAKPNKSDAKCPICGRIYKKGMCRFARWRHPPYNSNSYICIFCLADYVLEHGLYYQLTPRQIHQRDVPLGTFVKKGNLIDIIMEEA